MQRGLHLVGRQGIRSRLPVCVDANEQHGQVDPTQGQHQGGPRGRSHLGEMPDVLGLACLTLGDGVGASAGPRALSVCRPGVRRASPARVAGRVRSRPGTGRATHINQVGSLDDLQPSVVWKRVRCQEPPREIPPMTRSCGRELLSKASELNRFPRLSRASTPKPKSVCFTIS